MRISAKAKVAAGPNQRTRNVLLPWLVALVLFSGHVTLCLGAIESVPSSVAHAPGRALVSANLSPAVPLVCLYVTANDWDHYLLFAMTEINEGRYDADLGAITPIDYRILYADPTGTSVAGDTQVVFDENYHECSVFVGPAWSSQLTAIGEWATLIEKPIVSGGATDPSFSDPEYSYVTQVIPSDTGLLDAFVQLIVQYNISSINIVYYNDSYGQGLAQALVSRSEGLFEVQLTRSYGADSSEETIQDILTALDESLTHATFLSMTVLPIEDFLNKAGQRGMHETQLWLSPAAAQIYGNLDPPAVGAWGLSYGQELTPNDPLSQRYLAKDPAPHIAAYEQGLLQDDYNALTYWGAYAYDAVLAAVYGMAGAAREAAQTNQTTYDGAALLRAILDINIPQGSTGTIRLDKNGDRIGARIPLFYGTPNGTGEEFAYFADGHVSILKAPLWPGGKTTRPPNLIRSVPNEIMVPTKGVALWVIIVLPVVVCGVVLLAWVLWLTRQHLPDVRVAPKAGSCCLLFTDIQSSSTLWGMAPSEMSRALGTHHHVIRTCLRAHQGYEVKTIGDCFMIACADPDKALRIAVDLQTKLYEADWDPAIDKVYANIIDDPAALDPKVWKGLRVRVSVHYGTPDIVLDEVSQGYDYYGTVCNEAARIEGLAHGGQIVVSAALKNALKDPPAGVQLVALGDYELRGCPGKTELWNAIPDTFKMRTFPPLRTADSENGQDESAEMGLDFTTPDNDEVSYSTMEGGLNIEAEERWFRTLVSIFTPSKRQQFVENLCKIWHCRSEEQLMIRITKVSRARSRPDFGEPNGLSSEQKPSRFRLLKRQQRQMLPRLPELSDGESSVSEHKDTQVSEPTETHYVSEHTDKI